MRRVSRELSFLQISGVVTHRIAFLFDRFRYLYIKTLARHEAPLPFFLFLARLQNVTPIRFSDDTAKRSYVLRLRAFCINYIHWALFVDFIYHGLAVYF